MKEFVVRRYIGKEKSLGWEAKKKYKTFGKFLGKICIDQEKQETKQLFGDYAFFNPIIVVSKQQLIPKPSSLLFFSLSPSPTR